MCQQVLFENSRLRIRIYDRETVFLESNLLVFNPERDDMRLKLFSAILLLLFYVGSVSGADLFQLTITEGGVTKTMSYSSVDELPDYNTMKNQFSGIDFDNGQIDFLLNYRGIELKAAYPNAASDPGGNKVTFNIPSLNKNWSYEGASRQGSWTQLTDALVQ